MVEGGGGHHRHRRQTSPLFQLARVRHLSSLSPNNNSLNTKTLTPQNRSKCTNTCRNLSQTYLSECNSVIWGSTLHPKPRLQSRSQQVWRAFGKFRCKKHAEKQNCKSQKHFIKKWNKSKNSLKLTSGIEKVSLILKTCHTYNICTCMRSLIERS